MKKFTKKSVTILFALVLAISSSTIGSLNSSNTAFAETNDSIDTSVPWTPVKYIDFSAKHDVMIKNDDGSLTPMDEPYFKTTQIAPGTWQILTDGDYIYLVEGDDEALVIDTGYGAGNIREYCQSLTEKPIKNVVNTHYHFDHTANNAYFDCAYMSADSVENATIPGPSFEGIDFPRNYPIEVIGEGYKFELGNRELEVFEIPNHTIGGIALLDRRERLLFSGDEIIMDKNVTLNCSVTQFEQNMSKLAAHRSEFDKLCGGFAIVDASAVDNFLANAQYILSGQGTPQEKQSNMGQGQGKGSNDQSDHGQVQASSSQSAQTTYTRHMPHPEDMGDMQAKESNDYLVQMTYSNCTITYDSRRVEE